MKLSTAFRLNRRSIAAIIGAGGKTTCMFACARELLPAIVTTTTHLAVEQAKLADIHLFDSKELLQQIDREISLGARLILATGPADPQGRLIRISTGSYRKLRDYCIEREIPLFIEADGAKGLPIKAPAPHEPAIPAGINTCIAVCGLSGLWSPVSAHSVFRVDELLKITGKRPGDLLAEEDIVLLLRHENGMQKGVPTEVDTSLFLNQLDTPSLVTAAEKIALQAQDTWPNVVLGRMQPAPGEVFSCRRPIAGVILAAGGSSRFGGLKQLVDWCGEPLIRHIVNTTLQGGLSPVIVIAGYEYERIIEAIADLPVLVVKNEQWQEGQSRSVILGSSAVLATREKIGAAIFLLTDQPFVTPELIHAMLSKYSHTGELIIAPVVEERRVTPVLFDREILPRLLKGEGDSGGRGVIAELGYSGIPWADPRLALEIDTQNDYQICIDAIK